MRQDRQLLQRKKIPWPCLFKNNFNDDFIRRNNYRLTRTTEINDTATPTLATIPYIKSMYDNIWRILQPFNIYVVHKPITTLRQLPTNFKDKDEPKNRQGTVYEINYSDCQAPFIGETGRNRFQRVRVWRNYVNKQSVDFQCLSVYPGASSWDFYRIFKQVKVDRRWTALFYQIWREYTHLHWHEKRKVPLCQHPMAKPFIQKRLKKPV